MNTVNKNIVLASASPRRQQLLRLLLGNFTVCASDVDEAPENGELPYPLVRRLAEAKARAAEPFHADAIIIGADTVVVYRQHVLGKPTSAEDAMRMLKLLSGKTHFVLTGLCVLQGGVCQVEVAQSFVSFNRMSADEIKAYLETGEPMDKAGAYAIQGYGSRFIEKVEGCFFNVVGLPVSRLYHMLMKAGYDFHG
jgi:septum formation protein